MGMLEDLSTYLAAQGIGTEGTDLFIGAMPDSPDACVAIYQYSGLTPIKAMGIAAGGYVFERPRVNVRVRSTTFVAGQAKAQDVFDKLGGYSNDGVPGIVFVDALQSPFQLGPDENNRQLFGCNFEVVKR